MKAFFAWLLSLFASSPAAVSTKPRVSRIPEYGDKSDDVKVVQTALIAAGFDPGPVDGYFLSRTEKAVSMLQKSKGLAGSGEIGPQTLALLGIELGSTSIVTPPSSGRVENPAYVEAKKYAGKTEFDASFRAKIVPYWKKAGLPSFKTIVGSGFAWCALFIVMVQSDVGQKYVASALAKDHARSGIAIDWRKDGIPRGAIMHINHNACGSSSGNHVTFADGDCSAADLAKAGATFPGFGGNQQDSVKRSVYSVKEICAVRWPSEVPLPGPITKSVNCTTGASSQESTR